MYNINDKIKTMFGGVLHDGVIVGKHGSADYYAVKLDDGTACYRYGADFVEPRFQINIRGMGGVFTFYGDKKRVEKEKLFLPDGWTMHVWDVTDKNNPRKYEI